MEPIKIIALALSAFAFGFSLGTNLDLLLKKRR